MFSSNAAPLASGECLAAEVPVVQLRGRSASPQLGRTSSTPSLSGSKPPRSPNLPGNAAAHKSHPKRPYLPLFHLSEQLQQLYQVAAELAALWDEAGADDRDRLRETDLIAAPAVIETRACLAAWRRQQADLAAQCEALRLEAQRDVDRLGGELGPELALAAGQRLSARLAALQQVQARVSERVQRLRELQAAHASVLSVLGRDPREMFCGIDTLEEEVAQLEELVRERRASSAQHVASVCTIWKELGVEHGEDSNSVDLAIHANAEFGVSDAEHEMLLSRLAFWQADLAQRQEVLSELHRQIRGLAVAMPNQGQLESVAEFLQWSQKCRDIPACEEKLSKLKEAASSHVLALEQRRETALRILAVEAVPLQTGDLVEHLIALASDVDALEAKVGALRACALAAARCARAIWEELGEEPELPRDEHAVSLLSAGQTLSADVTGPILEAIEASCSAWEARRVETSQELGRLHTALRGFGSPEDVEPFISAHSRANAEDRAACRLKLRDLQAMMRAEEEPVREQLRLIYDETGLDPCQLDVFFLLVDEAPSLDARRRLLSDEVERMKSYHESVRAILAQLEELKGLVVEGARFESVIQAGGNRFSGNSLHFLEEEKFRKLFSRRYPSIRDSLIAAILAWESQDEDRCFVYRGSHVRVRLLEMRELEADLVKAPGDLSVVGRLLQVLDVKEVVVGEKPSSRSPSVPRRRPPPPRDAAAEQPSVPAPARGAGNRARSRADSRNPPGASPTPPSRALSPSRAPADGRAQRPPRGPRSGSRGPGPPSPGR